LFCNSDQTDAALSFDVGYFAVQQVLIMFIPIGFVFAMLRYRLWNVDEVINRALVYSGLTTTLGLMGVISVALLNYILK
jgi:hypothetical protein